MTITLLEWPVRPLAKGDGFIIRASCDKRLDACRARSDDFANVRGLPIMPGQDAGLRQATPDGGHAGEVL